MYSPVIEHPQEFRKCLGLDGAQQKCIRIGSTLSRLSRGRRRREYVLKRRGFALEEVAMDSEPDVPYL